MNHSVSAMKLINYTIAAALLGLVIFILSISLGFESIGAYAALIGTLFFASAINDYAPRRPRWEPSRRTACAHFPTRAHVIRHRAATFKLAS
jgi:hypothetical protein